MGNAGDGVLALFEGSEDGLTLASSATSSDLPSPTAVVFVGLAGGDVEFYGATEGQEAAVLVALSLGVGTTTSSPPSLVPLQESSLALVGTLLVVTVESSANNVNLSLAETQAAISFNNVGLGLAETGAAISFSNVNLGPAETGAAISLSSGAPIAVGQSLFGQGSSYATGAAGPEPPAQRDQATAGAGISSPPGWLRFLLGTDEAIERFNREHPDLSQPRSDEPPAISPTGGHSERQPSGPPMQDVWPGQSTSGREQTQTERIDRAIELLDEHEPFAWEQSFDRGVRENSRTINAMNIGMVGCTQPTIYLGNGRVGETNRLEDDMSTGMIDVGHRTIRPEPGREERYDLMAALALAATVVGGIHLHAPDRKARTGAFWNGSRGGQHETRRAQAAHTLTAEILARRGGSRCVGADKSAHLAFANSNVHRKF